MSEELSEEISSESSESLQILFNKDVLSEWIGTIMRTSYLLGKIKISISGKLSRTREKKIERYSCGIAAKIETYFPDKHQGQKYVLIQSNQLSKRFKIFPVDITKTSFEKDCLLYIPTNENDFDPERFSSFVPVAIPQSSEHSLSPAHAITIAITLIRMQQMEIPRSVSFERKKIIFFMETPSYLYNTASILKTCSLLEVNIVILTTEEYSSQKKEKLSSLSDGIGEVEFLNPDNLEETIRELKCSCYVSESPEYWMIEDTYSKKVDPISAFEMKSSSSETMAVFFGNEKTGFSRNFLSLLPGFVGVTIPQNKEAYSTREGRKASFSLTHAMSVFLAILIR
jgi:tRNA G18 (ribose-2'-O)-methylase SpoU